MTRQEILKRQQEIVDAAKRESRDLTETERAEFDDLQRQLDELPETAETGGGSQEQRAARATTTEQMPPQDPQQAAQRAIAEERKRAAEITSLCRSFGISPEEYINNGSTMDQVREAVLGRLQQTGAPVNARVTADEGDKFRSRASDGMLLRAGIAVESLLYGHL